MRSDAYWIEGPWPGRLAIVPRPRGGDWLNDEAAGLRRLGINAVVSMLTSDEEIELGLAAEKDEVAASGAAFVAIPVTDRGTPTSFEEFAEGLAPVFDMLAHGKTVAVHCRQGIGRAAMATICLLIVGGVDVEHAIRTVSDARGFPTPETPEQRRWVADFADSLSAARSR